MTYTPPGGCPAITTTVDIAILAGPTLTLTSAAGTDNQAVCEGTAITDITYDIGGTAASATVSGLPAGITFSFTDPTVTITETGTPVFGVYPYTVSSDATACGTAVANGTITISQPPSTSVAGTPQVLAACATASNALDANDPTVGTGVWTCISGDCGTITPAIGTLPYNGTITGGLVPGTTTILEWTVSSPGCTSSTSQVSIEAVVGPTCAVDCLDPTPPSSDAFGWITIVTVNGGTPNITGWNGYTDYLGLGCSVMTQGEAIDFDFTVYNNSNGGQFSSVFFDWNGDGDFTSDEEYQLGSNTTINTTNNYPLTLSVPCDAVIGSVTMRVTTEYSAYPSGCNNTSIYGEIEDYCITIIAETPPTAVASGAPVSCTSTANLSSIGSSSADGFWSIVSGTGVLASNTDQVTTIGGLENGTTVVQWTATGNCATDVAQVSLVVSGLPDTPVNAGIDIFSCLATVPLSGSDPSPYVGTWTISPALPVGGSISNVNDPNATVTGMDPNGTYTLTWTVATGVPCNDIADAVTLSMGSLPTPAPMLPITGICPTSTNLNATPTAGLTGLWSQISGTAQILDVNDPNTLIYDLAAGVYQFSYVLSGGGCSGVSAPALVTVTVDPCTTTIAHDAFDDQTATGCQFTYTDDGGAGPFSANVQQTTTTFCPDDPNAFATIDFTSIDLYPYDYINIYDAVGNDAPVIATYYYYAGNPSGWQSVPSFTGTTITSSTGCLYVQFNSTTFTPGTEQGWTADIGCSSTAGVQSQVNVNEQNCGGGGGITICDQYLIDEGGSVDVPASSNTNPPDLGGANQGCLGSGEGASNTWVYMVIEETGWLTFEMQPAGGQDFDYAIWGPYDGGFACPGVTGDDPIRCTWAPNGGMAPCDANIGLSTVNTTGNVVLPTDVSEDGFCNTTFNEGWTYPVWGTAGDVYVLLFQNYGFNNSSFGFLLGTGDTPEGVEGSGTENYATLGCDPPVALPISLLNFSGDNVEGINKLYWTTASEHQNDYFTIEKSDDGESWTKLADVRGAINSQEIRNYSIIDYNPFQKVTYYRLLQTDLDGQKRKYKVIAINSTSTDIFGEIFPNPADQVFYFNYGGKDLDTDIVINVYNTMGQLVANKSIGQFNSSQSIEIDASDLSVGLYQVELIQGDYIQKQKVSVMR